MQEVQESLEGYLGGQIDAKGFAERFNSLVSYSDFDPYYPKQLRFLTDLYYEMTLFEPDEKYRGAYPPYFGEDKLIPLCRKALQRLYEVKPAVEQA